MKKPMSEQERTKKTMDMLVKLNFLANFKAPKNARPIRIKGCSEINGCSKMTQSTCLSGKSGVPCWFFFEGCPCMANTDANACEKCPTYANHRKELEEVGKQIFDGNSEYVFTYLNHLSPLFNMFLPEGSPLQPIALRRKKIMANAAIRILNPKFRPVLVSIEKYLYGLYLEMFGKVERR